MCIRKAKELIVILFHLAYYILPSVPMYDGKFSLGRLAQTCVATKASLQSVNASHNKLQSSIEDEMSLAKQSSNKT